MNARPSSTTWRISSSRSDHLIEAGIAIAVVIALRTASEILVKRLIGVVEPIAGEVQGQVVIASHDFGKPLHCVDRVEISVNVNLLHLIDQDHRRVAKWRNSNGYPQ